MAEMERQLGVQLKSQMLDESNRISILSFLPAFQMVYDTRKAHEGTVMCDISLFYGEKSQEGLNAGTCLSNSNRTR